MEASSKRVVVVVINELPGLVRQGAPLEVRVVLADLLHVVEVKEGCEDVVHAVAGPAGAEAVHAILAQRVVDAVDAMVELGGCGSLAASDAGSWVAVLVLEVAGEQDLVPLLLGEAVEHLSVVGWRVRDDK